MVEDVEDSKEEDEAGAGGSNKTLGNNLILSSKIQTIRSNNRFKTILSSNSNKMLTPTYVGQERTINIVGHMVHADTLQVFAGFRIRDIVGKRYSTTK